jgi:hypothetical protein
MMRQCDFLALAGAVPLVSAGVTHWPAKRPSYTASRAGRTGMAGRYHSGPGRKHIWRNGSRGRRGGRRRLWCSLWVGRPGSYNVLYRFTGGADGGFPASGVLRDSAGNLYGTTNGGGLPGCTAGCGVVYNWTPPDKKPYCTAPRGADGDDPYAGLTADSAGNLNGTTPWGGKGNGTSGGGVVFKISGQ